MGCDLLALDLVRNWEFLLPAPTVNQNIGGEADPRKMLRRRSSLVVADLPLPPVPLEMKTGGAHGGKHHPPSIVFEEPEGNSLLDSFGF
jgi:hypothetical protein